MTETNQEYRVKKGLWILLIKWVSLRFTRILLHLVLKALKSSYRSHKAMLDHLLPLQASLTIRHLLWSQHNLLFVHIASLILRVNLIHFALKLNHLNLEIFYL